MANPPHKIWAKLRLKNYHARYGHVIVDMTAQPQLWLMSIGLRGTRLTVCAGIYAVALIMSGMFAGLSIRPFVAPRQISGVEHIRTVVALAPVNSAAALMHLALINPWVSITVCSLTGLTIGGQVLRFPPGRSFHRRSREE